MYAVHVHVICLLNLSCTSWESGRYTISIFHCSSFAGMAHNFTLFISVVKAGCSDMWNVEKWRKRKYRPTSLTLVLITNKHGIVEYICHVKPKYNSKDFYICYVY